MSRKKKGLSALQLTMMAIGTVIGGSFFLGSSVAIHAAGPSVLIAYVFGGILVYFILFAISEMTIANPDSGSFRTFAAKTFGEGAGFVVGWVYWTGMVLGMSSEATAVSILVQQWIPNLSIPVLGSLVIIGVTLLNLLGADKLSKIESGLASIKVFAIIGFSVLAVLLIAGLFPGKPAVGIGQIAAEPFMPGGIMAIAGSMLVVMFAYAGFEIIGFAASETSDPIKVVPKAIRATVFSLIALFLVCFAVLLPLISTASVNESRSPLVAALNQQGIGWAGAAINVVLITAILSTMLAAMFGLGRMMRSLAEEGHAPGWLGDKTNVPYHGIIASGIGMLAGLGFGLLFPRVYLFLISSGGFSILFTYAVIMATHIKFRKEHGCPPTGQCQLWGFPYTSVFVLVFLIISMVSMPFVSGQAPGLIAGIVIVVFFIITYNIMKAVRSSHSISAGVRRGRRAGFATETSKELADAEPKSKNIDKKDH